MQLDKDRHIFALADIHGCDIALATILQEVRKYECQTIQTGDILDRGPSSPNVVQMLIGFKMERPDSMFLMGNHEKTYLSDLEENIESLEQSSAISQYKTIGGIPHEHLEFLQNLQPYHESNSFIFCHAGPEKHNFHLPLNEHPVEELIWVFRVSSVWKGKKIIRGHQVVAHPEEHSHCINLDTGCCYEGGKLTAGILDNVTGKLVGYIQASNGGDVGTTFL
jgi:serine/threonine protein phosphatase 1